MSKREKLQNYRDLLLKVIAENPGCTSGLLAEKIGVHFTSLSFKKKYKDQSLYAKALYSLINRGIVVRETKGSAYAFFMKGAERNEEFSAVAETENFPASDDGEFSAEAFNGYLKCFFQHHVDRQTTELRNKVTALEADLEKSQGETVYWENEAKRLKTLSEQSEAKFHLPWFK